MINIRFHLVSLVAVFLALGIGVATGASFIDRATVENMRGRVDDLEAGYRDRGSRLTAYRELVEADDAAALDLTSETSRAIDGVLAEQALVLVTTAGIPEEASDVITGVVRNAGATLVGTLELQPDLTPSKTDGELQSDDVDALGAALDVDLTEPSQPVVPEDVESRARAVLAEALAALSARPEPGSGADLPDTATDGAVVDVVDVDEARAVLDRYGEAGLITLDGAGLPADEAFPAVSSVRYVFVLSTDSDPSGADWVVPFVEDYGESSIGTMLVAGVDETRDPGQLPESPDSAKDLGALLESIRSGPVSGAVTTVQAATEPLARLSVVFGLQAATEGIVGHYGLGADVSTPFPPVVQE